MHEVRPTIQKASTNRSALNDIELLGCTRVQVGKVHYNTIVRGVAFHFHPYLRMDGA
jgi:hypothetical protein